MDQASPILHKRSRNSFTMNIMGLTFYGKFRREKFVKLSSASDTATNLRFIIDSIYLPVCLSILDFLHFKWLSFFIWIAYLVWNLDYDSWGAWVSGHHVPGGRFTCSFLFIFGQGKAPSGSPGFHTFPLDNGNLIPSWWLVKVSDFSFAHFSLYPRRTNLTDTNHTL